MSVNEGGIIRFNELPPKVPRRPKPPWLGSLKGTDEHFPGDWFLVERFPQGWANRAHSHAAALRHEQLGVEVTSRSLRDDGGSVLGYGIFARLPVEDKVVRITGKSATG